MEVQKVIDPALGTLLIASVLTGLSWAALIPPWHTPDEQAHFAQAQDFAAIGRRPNPGLSTSKDIVASEELLQTIRDQRGNNKFTYHPEYRIPYTNTTVGLYEREIQQLPLQSRSEFVIAEATGYPPLYYWYVAGINRLFWGSDLITRIFLSRAATVLLTTAAVATAYLLAKKIFRHPAYAAAAGAVVSFHPMWRYVGSGVTSDALFNMVYPLLIFCTLKLLEGSGKYFWLTLGVFILGIMTKLQMILLLPILIPVWIWTVWNKKKFSVITRSAAATILVALLIGAFITAGNYLAPKLMFNWLKSFGLEKLDAIFFLPEFSNFRHAIGVIDYVKIMGNELYVQVFPWYWGVYRWLSLTLPIWIYRIIKVFIAVSLLGWVFGVRKRDFTAVIRAREAMLLFASSMMYAVGLISWNYFFWKSHGYSLGIQGRYFFPNLPEHMILLLAGLILFVPTVAKKYAAIIAAGVMVLLNWYSLWFVSSSYYDSSSFSTFFLQASQYKPWFFKWPFLSGVIVLGLVSSGWFLWEMGVECFKEEGKRRKLKCCKR